MRALARAVALAGAVTVLIAGCTGIPTKSSPQVIGPVGGTSPSVAPTIGPTAGADPRSIVKGFLAASATSDQHHVAAKSFLTADARSLWKDTTVTVVDSELVGNFNAADSTVTVSGRQLGSINAAGVYSPVLKGAGDGGDVVPISFGLRRVSNEWRIDSLNPGILIGSEEFQRLYQQRSLYFMNRAGDGLVPDPRFTALVEPSDLATWLVAQLAAGPRPELQDAVSTGLPAQTDPGRVGVTIGAVTVVEVPGASQLDAATRNQLAAQLSQTLQPVVGQAAVEITDGGKPVTVPAVGTSEFTAAQFASLSAPSSLAPRLYYLLTNGGLVDSTGKPVAGQIGAGGYNLTSVAVAATATSDAAVAGTNGPAADERLVIGSVRTGLRATAVHGQLSRPAWAPRMGEVWVGDGAAVYRANAAGHATLVPLSASVGTIAGHVRAIRLSPEGSRVAIVLAARDGTAQVWVGSVVRNAGQVRVDSLEPITPLGEVISDVAWNDQLKLFVIGKSSLTNDTNIFVVQVDGSLWTLRSSANLPADPETITVASGAPAWVSVGTTVWTQPGSSWASPGNDVTYGTDPVYAE